MTMTLNYKLGALNLALWIRCSDSSLPLEQMTIYSSIIFVWDFAHLANKNVFHIIVFVWSQYDGGYIGKELRFPPKLEEAKLLNIRSVIVP